MVGLKRRAGEGRKGRSELLVDQLGLGRIGSDGIVSFPAHATRDLPQLPQPKILLEKKNNVIKYYNLCR